MKRVKKITRKPDSMEESSDHSDSEEEPTKPIKKGKEKKTPKIPKPFDHSDNDEVPIKKGKTKNKRVKLPLPAADSSHDSDSDDVPAQVVKKTKAKPKKSKMSKMDESNLSDLKNRKTKGKKAKLPKSEGSSEQSDSDDEPPQTLKNFKNKGKSSAKTEEESTDNAESDNESVDMDPEKLQKSLKNLKRIDPDFYSFLEENDQELLNFEDDDDGLDERDSEKEEEVHVPGELHGDSDESDFEAEDGEPTQGKVTLKMVKEWEAELQKDGKMKMSTFNQVVKIFHAAVVRATSVDGSSEGELKVKGSSVFNDVLQMCVLYLPSAIKKYLGMEQSGKDPQKCKHFVKIKGPLIQYLTDLLKLLSSVTSDHILTIMLKHLHQMSKYVACFTRIAKQAIKKLISLWSTGEETVRVLAFMCILRITRNQQASLLDVVLKVMYMTFVKNCKFVSPSTWPSINFMRRSLVEMFSLDLNVTYPHAFLYIRQLGILLRNAIVVNKVESRQAVYNWQYFNSLHLWADLIQTSTDHADMHSLFYPLSMIASYTIKLTPTPQYYPARFFLLQIIMDMQKESGIFIPTLAYFLEVLNKFDFNKKSKKVSMKPLDFSCIIRLSKSQMNENGSKDATLERLYALLLEYTATIANTLAFPDVITILRMQLRDFIDKCQNTNYTKKISQLLEKIEENSQFIHNERNSITFSLADANSILAWQASIKAKGTPLLKFYENWSKINKIQKRKKVSKNDETATELPMIKRPKISDVGDKLVKVNNDNPMTLFPSDSEDEIDLLKKEPKNDAPPSNAQKNKKAKKKELQKKKKNIKTIDDKSDIADSGAGDIVQEFNVKDW